MSPIALFMAAALVGAEVGWQPLPEGGVEYIIEISPDALDSLRVGASDPERHSSRRAAGNPLLPHHCGQPEAAAATAAPADPGGGTAGLQAAPAPTAQPVQSASGASTAAADASAESPQKPWPAHWLTAVALFASLAGNLFLGWIGWDARNRYRAVLAQSGIDRRRHPTQRAGVVGSYSTKTSNFLFVFCGGVR